MSQICYKLEIVKELLQKNNHIRSLAKELKTNQMMVSRKIKELEKDNVVDYRQEGKNKVYFLKKTIEAEQFVFILEHYKLLKLIRKYPWLKLIFQKIKANSKIKLALVFGSYAKGLAHKDSDVDIYIETRDIKIKKELQELNTKLGIKIGKYDQKNLLIKEIKKNHIIIKGVEKYYEKNKFFN